MSAKESRLLGALKVMPEYVRLSSGRQFRLSGGHMELSSTAHGFGFIPSFTLRASPKRDQGAPANAVVTKRRFTIPDITILFTDFPYILSSLYVLTEKT